MFSGRTNCGRVSGCAGMGEGGTDLVELIAEVYGVDVVALEVGEHDDLCGRWRLVRKREGGRTKKTMVKRRPAAMRTEKRKSHPGRRQRARRGTARDGPEPPIVNRASVVDVVSVVGERPTRRAPEDSECA